MNISVLGCGRWGAFLAWYLGRMEQHNVLLYGRERSWRMAQLRETRKNDLLDLPARVTLTSDIHKAVDNSEILLISIGVQSFRGFLRELSCCNLSGKKLVLCMKGLEAETGLRLTEIVRQELNSLLALTDKQVEALVKEALRRAGANENPKALRQKREKIEARIGPIDKIVTKLYTDNAEGRLDDERLQRMVADLEKESVGLQAALDSLTISRSAEEIESSYANFFSLAREYTQIQELDRETLLTFVERIEIGPKKYPEGTVKATHRNQPYRQSIRIVYKFIGEVAEEPVWELPAMSVSEANDTPA